MIEGILIWVGDDMTQAIETVNIVHRGALLYYCNNQMPVSILLSGQSSRKSDKCVE